MIQILNNWRLARKMAVAFIVIAVLISGLTAASSYVISGLSAISRSHVERGITCTEALGRLMSRLREHNVIILTELLPSSAAERQTYAERYAKNQEEIQKALADIAPLVTDFQAQFDALKAADAHLEEVNARFHEVLRTQGIQAAMGPVKAESADAVDATLKVAKGLIDLNKERTAQADASGEAFASKAFWTVIGLFGLCVVLLGAIWKLIAKTVSEPMADLSQATVVLAEGGKSEVPHRDRSDELGEVAQAVEQFRIAAVQRAEIDRKAAESQQLVTSTLRDGLDLLSKGDLTAQITADYPSEYAALKANFNSALDSLRQLIGSVTESAMAIRTGSGEIAHASEDLARRTETNAASLEQTAAAVTQMDGRLKATAEAANRTVTRADGAITTVRSGRSLADETVQAMARVAEGAKGIDSVIEGLDKIAFQTRVLAMNAAVEAGRAGEAGRGFAVVADLVSALAMRSEEEAARAREQLTATQTDIIDAVDMVRKVDNALSDISGDVAEVHSLLGQIATDNQTQSTAISEISVAVGAMDHSTQQNAAMVEETSAAARNLSSEVVALSEQAARFKIGSGAVQHTPRAAVPVFQAPARTQFVATAPSAPISVVAANEDANGEWADF